MAQPAACRPPPFRSPLRPQDQACCAAAVLVSLAVMLGWWIDHGGHLGRLVDVDQAARPSLQFHLDVNSADWPEWTVLPGIGEKLAQRIVQSRHSEGAFRSHDDLLRVRGIGPRKLDQMRPYLLPVAPVASDPSSRLAESGRAKDESGRANE